ncbi:VAPA, partial [Symbiodinium pilosum]
QELPHEEAEPGEQEPEGPSFPAGIYVLLRPTFVSPAADIFAPDDDELIAELEEGEEIEIVEVEDFPEEERVRGRILDPDGWVTLMNTATGTVWASLK